MKDKIKMSEKMILVNMNEVDISTDDKHIIGTYALATCVGVLLYSEEKNRAIVAHVASEWKYMVQRTIDLIFENGMENSIIKYKIIPGNYYNNYRIKENLEEVYASLYPMFVPFSEKEFPDNAVEIDEATSSHQFAFDSLNGEFVSDKVLYGKEYFDVYEESRGTSGISR